MPFPTISSTYNSFFLTYLVAVRKFLKSLYICNYIHIYVLFFEIRVGNNMFVRACMRACVCTYVCKYKCVKKSNKKLQKQ